MHDLIETTHYDDLTDTFSVKTSYDNRAVIEANKQAQIHTPETGRYKGNLAHVGRIHMGDITRLKNEGYNLLSPDPDEVKRALLHIQTNEKYLLTVPGTPIAKRKTQWV